MDFYGIATEKGLEEINPTILTEFQGFKPDPKKLSIYAMEIYSNKEETKVLFLADLKPETYKEIQGLLEAGNKKEALKVLNDKSGSLSIMDADDAEEKWKKITA